MDSSDILTARLITVTLDGARCRGSLVDVLAWLSGAHEIVFAALQPHQHHPWHAFTVQLAAIALSRAKRAEFPADPAEWRKLLLALTDGAHEPWSLVVDDLSKPALLQPPVPEKTLDPLKNLLSTPDALDILLTTRNFDLKSQRMVRSSPEHWLFTLVTKQTFEGYSGKMNYGIHRMNGGQANRPCVALAPSRSWAPRFRRDVHVWLDHRKKLIDGYGYDPKGPALLWLLPWDGTESLLRPSLDPFFIEVCRRIRLTAEGDTLAAHMGTSQVARIDATDHAGGTGDIWTPTQQSPKKSGAASLTIPATGFTYKKIAELLFEEKWHRGAALELRDDDRPAPIVIAQALVRGQGKTEGYHERIIPIPIKARGFFRKLGPEELLGKRAKEMILRAKEARDALKPAILTLFQGATEHKLDLRDERADTWLDRLETRIDDAFFTTLFEHIDQDGDQAALAWDDHLEQFARNTFHEALAEAPIPSVHRFPIVVAAEGRFYSARRRVFERLLDERRSRGEPETEPSSAPDLDMQPGA
jgi:CRISPR system Cascade subunit CasA